MTEASPIITVSVSGELRANAPAKQGSTINLVLSSDKEIVVNNIAFDLAGETTSLLGDNKRVEYVKVALVPQDGKPTEALSIKNWGDTILAHLPDGITLGPDHSISLNLSGIACDRPPQDHPLELKIALYHKPITRPHAEPDATTTAQVKCSAQSRSFNALTTNSTVVLEGQLKDAVLSWDIEAPIGTEAHATLHPRDQTDGVRSHLLMLQGDKATDKTVVPLEAGAASFADLFEHESKVLNFSDGPVRVSMTITWYEESSDKHRSITQECTFIYLTTGHWRRFAAGIHGQPGRDPFRR